MQSASFKWLLLGRRCWRGWRLAVLAAVAQREKLAIA
jgi:hypothetical protein